jgi:cyclohexanone monooxygenase
VHTDDGVRRTAQFVVAATGTMSVPKDLEVDGLDGFAGELYSTAKWPHTDVDFTGKRVAVIGTGSSGIQIIPKIAEQAARLTVFQRTPNYAVPLRNGPLSPRLISETKARYRWIREQSRASFPGFPHRPGAASASTVTSKERRELLDAAWHEGGFAMMVSTFGDLLFSPSSNDHVSSYIRDRIDERVTDPVTAQLLKPTTYPYATKRPPMETNYYEVFNRDDVHLVDISTTPIRAATPSGIRTATEEYDVDVLVLATGFDAFTGALTRLGIVGRNGQHLAEAWANGAVSYLGIASHGFPNLFMLTGPQSAIAFYNAPLAIEDHVDFAAEAIRYVRDGGYATIEPTATAQDQWVSYVDRIAQASLLDESDSYWLGANVSGKPRVPLIFIGGAATYRAYCSDVVADRYRGFHFETSATRVR